MAKKEQHGSREHKKPKKGGKCQLVVYNFLMKKMNKETKINHSSSHGKGKGNFPHNKQIFESASAPFTLEKN